MTNEHVSVVKSFQDFFSIEFAKTEEQKRKVYGIRYRVYCEEFNYEAVEEFPDQEEKDEYDDSSLHCLIIHKKTGKPAGCVRMVPTKIINGEEIQLPFESHCQENLDSEFIDNLDLERSTVCEISRLAVDHLFRRRPGEELTRYGELDALSLTKQEKRTFSLIAVAAFLSATALTGLSGRTNVFAMMEPFLPRLLKRSGILFQKAGEDVNFRGIRAPYFIRTQSAIDNMNNDLKELYVWIENQIKETY